MGTALFFLVYFLFLSDIRQMKFACRRVTFATLLQSVWRNSFSPFRAYRHEQGHETVGETDRKESCGKEGDECDEPDEEC